MKNMYWLFLFLATSIFREVSINFAYAVKKLNCEFITFNHS